MNKQETYKTIFAQIEKAPDTWTGKLKVAAILTTELVCALRELKAPEVRQKEELTALFETIFNGQK